MVAILRQAGERLRRALRLTDTIARFSGWKFATLHEELKKPEDIQVVQGRLAEKLSEPYQVRGVEVTVFRHRRPHLERCVPERAESAGIRTKARGGRVLHLLSRNN
jgi:GGDEF domain-containing protein